MAHLDRNFKGSGYPHILNSVNYANAGDLYASESGKLKEGSSGGFRKRNGLAVTVTIPPTLRAFRYPNLTNQAGSNYYTSSDDKNEISSRDEWYKAAKANSANADKAITTLLRRVKDLTIKLNQAKKKNDAARVTSLTAQLAAARQQLTTARANSTPRILGTYSTEFEISDFITSLSWSSASENSFIEVSISLDNKEGLFNYLPEGAKVTIWRRKSLENINQLYGGKWYRYIVCYVARKTRSASTRSDQTMELDCGDRWSFAGAQKYTKKKKWVKDKAHPKGWTPREITLQICQATGVPVDPASIPSSYIIKTTVTKGTGKNRKSTVKYEQVTLPRIEYDKTENQDLQSLLVGAWNTSLGELARNKRLPYSIHMRSGALRVEFVGPPGSPTTQITDPGSPKSSSLVPMFTDEDNIESISLEESIEPESVWTSLKATGTYSYNVTVKGKKRKRTKKVTKMFYPSGLRGKLIEQAYGKRENVHTFKNKVFTSKKAFYTSAQQRIDNISRPKYTLKVDGSSSLGIWPKHYVYVRSRYAGVAGNIWVESVNYSVEEGRIKVSLTLHVGKTHLSAGDVWLKKRVNKALPEDRWY